MIIHQSGECRWEGVDIHPYKEEGTHFKSIHRQTLFTGSDALPIEFRYFEIAEGGHSTLERHEHLHLVMVLKGQGQVLVGDTISEIQMHDLVHVPAKTWHQFRASKGETLGFLCLVSNERDRPERPGDVLSSELERVRDFIRI